MDLRRLVVTVLAPLWITGSAAAARAQGPGEPGSEAIDDPKLARRLGTRIELGAPPAVAAEADGAGETGATPDSGGSVEARDESGGASLMPEVGGRELALGAGPDEVDTAGPIAPEGPRRTPRIKLGLRRFTFAQIAATAKATGTPGADEPFNVLSLDLYPVSSAWRLGLTTQYGWEGGTFRQGGDAFLAQSASLGGQVPGQVFTPFFEVYAGGGLMQRTHKDIMLNAAATAYGQLGVDVGSEIFLARYFCLSGALGYIHAGNGFVKSASFGSFSVDTISFKLGVGL
jgi:hypothetical protein